MQSYFQYRNLGRRLRDEHKSNRVSALSSKLDSGFSSTVDCQHFADKDIEKSLTVETPDQLFSPLSQSTETGPNEVSSSNSSVACVDISVANCTHGIEVRDDKTKSKNEKVFVVLPDVNNEMSPRKWARSIRIWATCVLIGLLCYGQEY